MATYSALDLDKRPMMTGVLAAGAVVHQGKVSATTGAINDIYRPLRIPAGTRIHDMAFVMPDLDSSTGFVWKAGYSPVNATDGPTAVLDYWATGQTTGQTAGRYVSPAAPITFAYDVYVYVTCTTATSGTHTAGDIYAIATGTFVGN